MPLAAATLPATLFVTLGFVRRNALHFETVLFASCHDVSPLPEFKKRLRRFSHRGALRVFKKEGDGGSQLVIKPLIAQKCKFIFRNENPRLFPQPILQQSERCIGR